MQVKAELKYLRIAPRKTRLVADLIRRKKIEEAQTILNFAVKKGTLPILKLLNSAVASAKNNFKLEPNNLYISKVTVDEGPKYKRWMPRARGSAYEIQKKTSHITIVLDELVKSKKGEKSQKTKEKPVIEETAEIKKEIEKPKFERKIDTLKPKTPGAIKRFFRRKSV